MGQVAQAAKCLATGWTARVSKEWRFFSLLRAQTGPGVHSVSYKMSDWGPSPGVTVKAVELRTSHSSAVDPCIHIPRGPSWTVMRYFYFYIQMRAIGFSSWKQYFKSIRSSIFARYFARGLFATYL